MSEIADGLYAYRFCGYGRDGNAMQNFIAGVGTLHLVAGRVTSGEHRSTYLRITGSANLPVHGRFIVDGDFTWNEAAHSGSAALVFTQQDVPINERQVLWGQFALVQAGEPARFWLISKDGTRVQNGNQPIEAAAEMVEGELIRLPG